MAASPGHAHHPLSETTNPKSLNIVLITIQNKRAHTHTHTHKTVHFELTAAESRPVQVKTPRTRREMRRGPGFRVEVSAADQGCKLQGFAFSSIGSWFTLWPLSCRKKQPIPEAASSKLLARKRKAQGLEPRWCSFEQVFSVLGRKD